MTRPIGDKSQPWKGRRYLDSDGYVQIYSDFIIELLIESDKEIAKRIWH